MIALIIRFSSIILQTSFYGVVLFSLFRCIFKRLAPRGMLRDLDKRYVLVTGCDSGFGKETAIRLDKMGFHVFAACLTREGEDCLKTVCSERVKTLHLNVTISESVQDAYNFVKSNIPDNSGLWGLINNAGAMSVGPIEWTPLDKYKRTADVNLWGVIDVTKTFLPIIKRAKGRVVNISSFLGQLSLQNMSPYCITKYGVEAFSDALRREMGPWGVRVVIIEPGVFKTRMADPDLYSGQINSLWNGLDADLKKDYGEENVSKLITRFECAVSRQANSSVYRVVDAVIDALTSLVPDTRYSIGPDAAILMPCATMLPTDLVDRTLALLYHQFTPTRKRTNIMTEVNHGHASS